MGEEDIIIDARPIKDLKVVELKQACKNRNLPHSGNKPTLIKRLKVDDEIMDLELEDVAGVPVISVDTDVLMEEVEELDHVGEIKKSEIDSKKKDRKTSQNKEVKKKRKHKEKEKVDNEQEKLNKVSKHKFKNTEDITEQQVKDAEFRRVISPRKRESMAENILTNTSEVDNDNVVKQQELRNKGGIKPSRRKITIKKNPQKRSVVSDQSRGNKRKWGKVNASNAFQMNVNRDPLKDESAEEGEIIEEEIPEEHEEEIEPEITQKRDERKVVVSSGATKSKPVAVKGKTSKALKRTTRSVAKLSTGKQVVVASNPHRDVSPAKNPPSCILHISNLVRPFALSQLKELLAENGEFIESSFWINNIKSHCLVAYSSEEIAQKTRNALHRLQWPASSPKKLLVEFSMQEEVDWTKSDQSVPPPKLVGEKNKLEADMTQTLKKMVYEEDKVDERRGSSHHIKNMIGRGREITSLGNKHHFDNMRRQQSGERLHYAVEEREFKRHLPEANHETRRHHADERREPRRYRNDEEQKPRRYCIDEPAPRRYLAEEQESREHCANEKQESRKRGAGEEHETKRYPTDDGQELRRHRVIDEHGLKRRRLEDKIEAKSRNPQWKCEPQDHRNLREWDRCKLAQNEGVQRQPKPSKESHPLPESRRRKHQESPPSSSEKPQLLGDLFRKTTTIPCLYWLPLTDEQVTECVKNRKEERTTLRREEDNMPENQEIADSEYHSKGDESFRREGDARRREKQRGRNEVGDTLVGREMYLSRGRKEDTRGRRDPRKRDDHSDAHKRVIKRSKPQDKLARRGDKESFSSSTSDSSSSSSGSSDFSSNTMESDSSSSSSERI